MRAKELMSGFYIRQNHCGFLLKVRAINPPYIEAEGEEGQFHEETIEPIPLTPNILENKFSCTNYTFEGETYKSFSSIGDGTQVVKVCFQSFGGIEVEIATRDSHLITTAIEYVHQLQHAMRLCGIEKEIVL